MTSKEILDDFTAENKPYNKKAFNNFLFGLIALIIMFAMFYISVAVGYSIPETWLPLYVVNLAILIFSVRGLNFNIKGFQNREKQTFKSIISTIGNSIFFLLIVIFLGSELLFHFGDFFFK